MICMRVVRTLLCVWLTVVPAQSAGNPVTDDPLWPVSGVVVHRFTPLRCERCRGSRGVEIVTVTGQPVRASVDGVVTFAGQVARRRFVVERLDSGVLLTYGWLEDIATHVRVGVVLARGEVIGTSGRRFYFGARERGRYIDPLALLGLTRPRLVGPGFIGRRAPSR